MTEEVHMQIHLETELMQQADRQASCIRLNSWYITQKLLGEIAETSLLLRLVSKNDSKSAPDKTDTDTNAKMATRKINNYYLTQKQKQ